MCKPLAAAVSLLLAFGCASPVEKGDETALRTQEADRGAFTLPQQANPGDYPDLRPTTTERPKPRVSRSAPRTTVARPKLPVSATGETRRVSSTAYCLTGTMASGKRVYSGAVAMNGMPFGSRWYAVELGRTFTVEDRIGHSSQFDIWMPSCRAALDYGRRTLTIRRVG